jgi:Ca-activated chloride channel family protein
MDLATVHFIRPIWLACLPLAMLLPLLWRYLRRPSGDWSKVCDEHLLRWLGGGRQAGRRGGTGQVAAGLSLAVAALALAGPSLQQLPDNSFSARDARVIVLDLSVSMLAEDLRPNRLARVRFRLADMLEAMQEGQMGLVAYAGDAYVVAPLTSDTNTIANMLPALRPDIIPVAGSRADRGLALAADLLHKAGMASGEILLVSDDADAAAVQAAGELAEQGITVSVLAVGTREGAPIPSGAGFVSDQAGNVVIARLDTDSLAAVAAAGRGRLSQLDTGEADATAWRSDQGGAFTLRDDTAAERWKDAGPWLVLLLLPLVAAGFRRGLLFAGACLFMPLVLFSQPASAGFWDDLWQRRDQQAQEALRQDQADQAARLAVKPELSGEAFYRNGDYARAAQAWSRGRGVESHYNRGNALALAGDLEGALAAYDRALAENPTLEDARDNRALVKQLMEQQQQEQQQKGEQGEESGEQEPSEQQSEGEPQEGADQDAEDGEQQEGEPQQPPEDDMEATWSEEDAQAMEQWLRRIPDDPGGLLRRKFRNEHQRRGAPEDDEQKW